MAEEGDTDSLKEDTNGDSFPVTNGQINEEQIKLYDFKKAAYSDDDAHNCDDVSRNCDDVSCNCDDEICGSENQSCAQTCWHDFWGYQLVILFASFMCYFIFCGVCYTVSIYYVAWIDEFQAGSGITSWLGSVHIGVLCGVAPLASVLTDRFGFRPVVMAGGLISTTGLLATVFADSIYTLLVTFSIVTAVGTGLVYVPSSTIVSLYFDRGRVLANGLFTSGAGFGNFIMAYVLHAGIEAFHWRGSMFISAGATLNLCVLGALMKPPQAWIEIQKNKKVKAKEGTAFLSGFHIYRSWGLVLFLIHMTLVSAGFSIVFVHVTAITEALGGVSRTQATLAISLIGLSSIFGRLATGLTGQHKNVDTFLYYVISMTLSGVSAIVVPFLSVYPCIITWSVVYGFLSAPNIALQQIMILHFVELSDLNAAFAHCAVFTATGYILGAPMAGWLFDYTHDYSGSFFLGGSFLTLGSLLLFIPYVKIKRDEKLTTVQLDEQLKATSFGSMIGSQYLEVMKSHDEIRRSRLRMVQGDSLLGITASPAVIARRRMLGIPLTDSRNASPASVRATLPRQPVAPPEGHAGSPLLIGSRLQDSPASVRFEMKASPNLCEKRNGQSPV